MTRMMKGKEHMMNKAEGAEPHSGHKRPAPAAGVGNEKKAQVKATQEGGSEAEAHGMGGGLKHAVHELHSQHPHKHHDHGPHHGTTDHIRHKPMHKG